MRPSRRWVFVALAVLVIVLAVNAPSQARGIAGHGFDRHPGFHGRFGIGPVYPYYPYYGYHGYYPPTYGYAAPGYWYYCQSYGAYYPNVGSCPEEWVPVPAS
jgi:hypothetical protein